MGGQVVARAHVKSFAVLAAAALVVACASKPRQLMPTPVLYQEPSPVAVFAKPIEAHIGSTDIDLLYITDRGPETDPESTLPYGQTRSKAIAFGSARVGIGRGVPWETLERESRLAQRTRDLDLTLGEVREIGRFPEEPYAVDLRPDGIYRDAADMRQHREAARLLREELARRLAHSPRKEVILYVHGFNETFATAAFTAAELCHFLGRESVCTFFTWPASSTGNFLISYTSTTESARYAENHLRKMIRLLATAPGVERVQLLAHSRGTALLMSAVRDLLAETVAAGKEPVDVLRIDNLVLFSPDIDAELFSQNITAGVSDPDMFSVWPSQRLPNGLRGRLTTYSSPQDRALFISRILFRSRSRVGNVRAEDVPLDAQVYVEPFNRVDMIVYEGERTDVFGHSYFTTNPRVSSDVIQLLRYGKKPGDPGRELDKVGPIVWKFPEAEDERPGSLGALLGSW
jgi:esterase/lipase superfamily enzyme